MTIYLMRHGIAEEAVPPGGDAERALTERGTLRTAMVAKGLRDLGVEIDLILHSPYVRARQTAEIVARVLEVDAPLLPDPRITPFGRFDEFADLLREHNEAEAMLVAGHEPSMSGFISGLCAAGELRIDVRKASVTAVEIDGFRPQPHGTLLWSLPPRVIEGLR